MRTTIFIGHHKTGSTALQSYYSQNFGRFVDAGVLYPFVDTDGLTVALRTALGKQSVGGSINVREPHNLLAFSLRKEAIDQATVPAYHRGAPGVRQQFRMIDAQVRSFEPDTMLFVSEVFSALGTDGPGPIRRFRKRAVPDGPIDVVCILRRPDEHLQSWFAQSLQFGRPKPIREGGLEALFSSIHFDYRSMLEPWLEVFDDATLHLWYLPDVIQRGGSIEAMNQLLADNGVAIPPDATPPLAVNPSIHPALLDLAVDAQRANPKLLGQEFVAWAFNHEAAVVLPDPSEVEVLGSELRAEIFDRFQPQKAWFDATFGRGTVFADIDQVLETRPVWCQDVDLEKTLIGEGAFASALEVP